MSLDGMTRYVLTSTSHSERTVYHTDEDCRMLKRATGYREVSNREIETQGLTECEFCSGEFETAGEKDMSYQKALREAAKQNAD